MEVGLGGLATNTPLVASPPMDVSKSVIDTFVRGRRLEFLREMVSLDNPFGLIVDGVNNLLMDRSVTVKFADLLFRSVRPSFVDKYRRESYWYARRWFGM